MTARGELRVHLGAASGAGATCAALAEAHRRAERGDDVVVGVVATHGRPRTAALLDGLETVAPPGELDVDAVLARTPGVVVVDELVRWLPGVEVLLDAGVDVLSTVRIAHLESLADIVEVVTGSRPDATVPDDVVRGGEVVLVDVTAQELRRRVADGDVHADVDAALAHAFAVPTLTALRELSLRWVADGLPHRTGETRERVVAVPPGAPRLPVPRGALPAPRRAAGWVLAVLAPAVATAIGVALRDVVGLSTDVVAYFLSVVVVALVGGLGPALLAALLAGFALNYFLTPPLYSLTIDRTENLVALVAMLLVGVLVALVVDAAARRAEQASRAQAEATLLASFARTLLTAADPLHHLLDEVRSAFGLRTVALLERGRHGWEQVAASGPSSSGPSSSGSSSGSSSSGRPGDADVDVAVSADLHLTGTGHTPGASDRRLLEAVGDQALMALRGQRAAAEAERAARRAEVNETRGALLSAVGHDLRSPLTSIKASAGTLRDPVLRLSDADRAELLAGIEESADRLTGLVANLLDSSRLAAGAVTPLLVSIGYDEVAVAALDGLEGADRVRIEIDERVPDVLADAGLLERVVANLVDNALRHGGGSPVVLRASEHAGRVELRVLDRGPGVAPRDRDGLFTPFQRLGDREATTGVGLGLSVARGLTGAMGGTLTAEDTPGGGLTAVVSLPAAGAS